MAVTGPAPTAQNSGPQAMLLPPTLTLWPQRPRHLRATTQSMACCRTVLTRASMDSSRINF